jgi:Excalibur calcium-binding domain
VIRMLVVALAAGALVVAVAPAPGSTVAVPYVWQSCTKVHTKYPHGVGKLNARDKTSGTPVTTFKRSTRLYNTAMSYNAQRGYNLDRDHDGIACEKR